MKKSIKKILIAVLIIALLFGISVLLISIGLFKKQLAQREMGNPGSSCRISISGTRSDFKNKVLEGILTRYKKKCYIKINSLFKLSNVDEDKYNAIIIFDDLYASMNTDLFVKRNIKRIKNKNKIIFLLTTNKKEDFKFSYEGVDAITCASLKKREKSSISKIIKKVDKLL
ncbi:hypothetical protein ACFL20_11940 [Spirochaetota bacterium]